MADPNPLPDADEDTPVEHADVTKNRRRLAWFFSITSALFFLIVIFYIAPWNVTAYDSIISSYFFLSGTTICAYMGTSAAMSYWATRK